MDKVKLNLDGSCKDMNKIGGGRVLGCHFRVLERWFFVFHRAGRDLSG